MKPPAAKRQRLNDEAEGRPVVSVEQISEVELQNELHNTGSIEALESYEQRHALDVVSQLRKCGLESVLSLPQLVVCGDQSAGKSSVLEALTEIPFPRNDNLCTRFATEIILHHAPTDSLQIKVIPDPERPALEQDKIRNFNETISNFVELPSLMAKAASLMGIATANDKSRARRAFAKDTLSITIEGPQRPHLTVVDLPGIIQSETKDTFPEDVALVSDITKHYISQPRTICLAVISATHDYANQGILSKVRKFDKKGKRTLGIITKPDRLPAGSGSEEAFINLAKNQDIHFELGWHVLKNRSFEQASFSFEQRHASEASFFRKSNFKQLAPDMLGIGNLVTRISQLLYQHILQVLPDLQKEANEALKTSSEELEQMGQPRVSKGECRMFLSHLGQKYSEVCKAAINGIYEGRYFQRADCDDTRSVEIRRLRAVIQLMNQDFSNTVRLKGHKYHIPQFEGSKTGERQDSKLSVNASLKTPALAIKAEAEPPKDEDSSDTCSSDDDLGDDDLGDDDLSGDSSGDDLGEDESVPEETGKEVRTVVTAAIHDGGKLPFEGLSGKIAGPTAISCDKSMAWVRDHIVMSRGRELPGNFNPLVIGELFWEQSSKWHEIAETHTRQVADVSTRFLSGLLKEISPRDVYARLWPRIQEKLALRYKDAQAELRQLWEDLQGSPINYNHYYTDAITVRRHKRQKKELKDFFEQHTTHMKLNGSQSNHTYASVNVDAALNHYFKDIDPDMDNHSCEIVLDCLFAIYKVSQKVFMANVTTQVIERHIIRGLDQIFSAVTIAALSEDDVCALSAEPQSARKRRRFLADRVQKLEEGREVLRQVLQAPLKGKRAGAS